MIARLGAALAVCAVLLGAGSAATAQEEAGVTALLVGPTLVAEGVDQQVQFADVTNGGEADTVFRLELDGSFFESDPVEATVPAGVTARIEVPLRPTRSTDGPSPVELTVFDGDTIVATSTLDVYSVDLSEPDDQQVAQDAVDEVQEDPEADPDVVDAVEEVVEPALEEAVEGDDSAATETTAAGEAEATTPSEPTDADDDGSFPVLPVAVAAGVVVLGGAGLLMMRGRR